MRVIPGLQIEVAVRCGEGRINPRHCNSTENRVGQRLGGEKTTFGIRLDKRLTVHTSDHTGNEICPFFEAANPTLIFPSSGLERLGLEVWLGK